MLTIAISHGIVLYVPAVSCERYKIWGYSSAGRALEWHSRGQRFDPAYLHHLQLNIEDGGIAQLGERLNGIQEVSGSIPLISTI